MFWLLFISGLHSLVSLYIYIAKYVLDIKYVYQIYEFTSNNHVPRSAVHIW